MKIKITDIISIVDIIADIFKKESHEGCKALQSSLEKAQEAGYKEGYADGLAHGMQAQVKMASVDGAEHVQKLVGEEN